VPGIVLLDWLVAEPPPPFLSALRALQHEHEWEAARDGLFAMWTHGVGEPKLERFIASDMGAYHFDMWSRAGREVERAYTTFGSPLQALAAMPASAVLHLYAQPDDPGFLAVQQDYSRTHSWFRVHKLAARSHFPMFEVPDEMARIIGEFAIQLNSDAPEAHQQ
jgi:pimeloyl-ACP methyl ester carboxylesterase